MALEAGSVYAVLGGRFNPSGFAQFDGAMKKSVASSKAAETGIAGSFGRTGRAAAAMSAAVAAAAAKVEAATLRQRRAALDVEAAQLASTAALKKHGAESLAARQATLALAESQATLRNRNNELAAATTAHAAAQQQMTQRTSRTSQAMSALGLTSRNVAAGGIAAVGLAVYGSLKASANFQKQMAELGAVTGTSGSKLKEMGDVAIDVGAKTGAGATNAAKALTELAKGGLDASTSSAALAGTVALAQAGSLDLAVAGETVANALNLFAMDGSEAISVADAFANAANATTADVGFFAQGMAQGGAAAKAAGLDFQEATVFLEAMAANGFKSGSDAGTSMKTALIQLANPTARAQAEMEKLGVTFFKSNGDMKSLPTISKQLGNAFQDLSNKEKLASATRLAGTDGMRALLALVDQGPKKLRGFAEANNVSGTAAEVARKKMESLSGQSKRLGSELEAAGIKIGRSVEPYLADAAGALADFFAQMREGRGVGGFVADLGNTFLRLSRTVQGLMTGFGDSNAFLGLSKIWGEGFTNASLTALGAIRAVLAAISAAASVGGRFNPFRGFAGKADEAIARIDGITNRLRELQSQQRTVKVIADTKDAIAGIRKVNNSKINKLVAKILAEDTPYKTKVRQLVNLKIPTKIARVLAKSDSAEQALRRLKAQLEALRDRTIQVRTVYSETGKLPKSGQRVPKQAQGRASGRAETALVGEGGGPEYIVDTATGRSRRVDSAQVVSLKDSEYVIPTEARYRGRALGLISQMAADMGLVGYERGRGARAAGRRQLTPEEKKRLAEARRLKAFQSHSLEWYDSEIGKEEAKADNKDKKGKLTAGAYKARRRLRELRAQRKLASDYKRRIDTATTEADIQTDRMGQAEKSGDRALFREASQERGRQLQRAIELLNAAIPKAKGTFKQSLRAQLERLKGEKVALDTDGTELPGLEGFDDPETQRIAELDAAIALAQIDTPLDFADDETAIRAKLSFLEGVLSGARGSAGPQRISAIAGAIRQTRDELASLTGGSGTPEVSADQQAQNEQKMNRDRINAQSAFIDRLVGATIGGANQTLVFQSYVPPSPTEAKRLADYTVGGIGYQGGVPSSRESVGV